GDIGPAGLRGSTETAAGDGCGRPRSLGYPTPSPASAPDCEPDPLGARLVLTGDTIGTIAGLLKSKTVRSLDTRGLREEARPTVEVILGISRVRADAVEIAGGQAPGAGQRALLRVLRCA